MGTVIAAIGTGITAVAGAVGVTVAAGTAAAIATGVVVGAVVGGVSAAINGGNILKGALMGGLIGGVTAGIGAALSPAASGATATGATAAGEVAAGEVAGGTLAGSALEVSPQIAEVAGLGNASASIGAAGTGTGSAITPFSYSPTTLGELVPGVGSSGYAPSVASTAHNFASTPAISASSPGLVGKEIAKQAGTKAVEKTFAEKAADSVGDRSMAVVLTGAAAALQKKPASPEEIAAAQHEYQKIYTGGNVAAAPMFSKSNIASVDTMNYYRNTKQGVAAA